MPIQMTHGNDEICKSGGQVNLEQLQAQMNQVMAMLRGKESPEDHVHPTQQAGQTSCGIIHMAV